MASFPPAGVRRIDGAAPETHRFKRAVPPGWDTAAAEGLKRRLKRMALLDWVVTLRVGSRGEISSPPVPASWARKTQDLIAAARHAVETYKPAPEKARKTPKSSCPDGPTIFALLSPEDFTDLQEAGFINWGHRSMARLNGLFAFGLMDDWPANDVYSGKNRKTARLEGGSAVEQGLLHRIGRAALWLSALTEEVLIAYLRVEKITTTPEGRRRHGDVQAHRTTLVQAWSPAAIRSGDVLPYALRLHGASIARSRSGCKLPCPGGFTGALPDGDRRGTHIGVDWHAHRGADRPPPRCVEEGP